MKKFILLILALCLPASSDIYHYSTGPDCASGTDGQVYTTNGTTCSFQDGGGGGGVSTMAAVGAVPNADGASISGSTLTLQPASASFPGLLTTGTQTIAGAKTFSTSPLTLSGGSSSVLGRSGKANVTFADSDAYLAVPGFEFRAGASGTTLLGVWDATQFGLSGNMIFVPTGTYDIGSGGFNPRSLTTTSTITGGGYVIMTTGPMIRGLSHVTATTAQALGANTHGIILDPASTTAAQTVTLPTSGNSADGLIIKVICGANGVTSLTIAAGSGTTVVGDGVRACIATSFGWIYRSANTTWYPY